MDFEQVAHETQHLLPGAVAEIFSDLARIFTDVRETEISVALRELVADAQAAGH